MPVMLHFSITATKFTTVLSHHKDTTLDDSSSLWHHVVLLYTRHRHSIHHVFSKSDVMTASAECHSTNCIQHYNVMQCHLPVTGDRRVCPRNHRKSDLGSCTLGLFQEISTVYGKCRLSRRILSSPARGGRIFFCLVGWLSFSCQRLCRNK